MAQVILDIQYPRDKAAFNRKYSLNSWIGGKHWAGRNAAIRDWNSVVILTLKQNRIRKKPFDKPYEAVFLWDDKLDVDNHSIIAKATIDALKGWVVVDDNSKWFRRVTHSFWRGGAIRVVVREVEN